MTKKGSFLLLVFFVICACVIVLNACEKRLFDYRNKYCGDYYFEVSETLNTDAQSTITNTTYDGSISYTKENERNEIMINYKPTSTGILILSTSGMLSESDSPTSNLSGQFFGKDSLHYVFTYSISPGAAGSRTVSGKRID